MIILFLHEDIFLYLPYFVNGNWYSWINHIMVSNMLKIIYRGHCVHRPIGCRKNIWDNKQYYQGFLKLWTFSQSEYCFKPSSDLWISNHPRPPRICKTYCWNILSLAGMVLIKEWQLSNSHIHIWSFMCSQLHSG